VTSLIKCLHNAVVYREFRSMKMIVMENWWCAGDAGCV